MRITSIDKIIFLIEGVCPILVRPFILYLINERLNGDSDNTQLSAYLNILPCRNHAVIFPGIMLLHIPFFGYVKYIFDEVYN